MRTGALRRFFGCPASNLASPADPSLIGRLAMCQVTYVTDFGYIGNVLLMFKGLAKL